MRMSGQNTWVLGFQPGGDANFCLEQFRYGAAGFRGFDGRVEFGFVRPWNTRDEVEMALGDGETVRELVESNCCCCFELACRHAGVSELRGERHGETTGVSGGQEFFRIGADPILKSRAKGILRLLEHATIC